MSSHKKITTTSTLVSNVASDVEYELNRCFLNNAKEQLIQKQFAVMMESNLLIDTLQQNLNKRDMSGSEKDMCNIATSNTLDTLLTQQDQLPRPRRLLTRKSGQNNQRQLIIDPSIHSALEDIKQNCSVRTFSTISKLYENYNQIKKCSEVKNQQSMTNHNRSGIVRMRPQTDRSNSDQAVILTARNIKLEKQNNTLNARIKELEYKLENLSTNQAKQDPIKSAKLYMSNHQKQLIIHTQKSQNFHNNIITALQNNFIEAGCMRCCGLIKKVKDSLVNYRIFLQEQIQNYRKLWEETHLNQNKTSNLCINKNVLNI